MLREGKEIFLLDGESDPRIYSEIVEDLPKDCKLNIICGPYVAVSDEEFLKYYNVVKNDIRDCWWYARRKKNWANIHPFFSKGLDNKNFKIFILRFHIFDSWKFCIEKYSGLIYAENQKGELERSDTNFFFQSKYLAEKGIELGKEISKDFTTELWNGETGNTLKNLERNPFLLFQPLSIFEIERGVKEQLLKIK